MTAPYQALVWIDDQEAKIVRLYGNGIDYRCVTLAATLAGPSPQSAGDDLSARTTYFGAVADALGDARKFLVTGPSVAKAAFAHWLERWRPLSYVCLSGFATLPRTPDGRLVGEAGRLLAARPVPRPAGTGRPRDRDGAAGDDNPCARCPGPPDALTLDCLACAALAGDRTATQDT